MDYDAWYIGQECSRARSLHYSDYEYNSSNSDLSQQASNGTWYIYHTWNSSTRKSSTDHAHLVIISTLQKVAPQVYCSHIYTYHIILGVYQCSRAFYSTNHTNLFEIQRKIECLPSKPQQTRVSCVVWSLEYLALCMQRKTQQKRGGCRPPGSPATPKQPHRQARALRIGRTTACVGQTCTGVLSHTQQTAAMCLLFPRTTTT